MKLIHQIALPDIHRLLLHALHVVVKMKSAVLVPTLLLLLFRVNRVELEQWEIRLGFHRAQLVAQLSQRERHNCVVEENLVVHLLAVFVAVADCRVQVELVDGRELGGEAAVLFERV